MKTILFTYQVGHYITHFFDDSSCVSTAIGCGFVSCAWRERVAENGKKFIEYGFSDKEYFPLSVEYQEAYQEYLVNKIMFES